MTRLLAVAGVSVISFSAVFVRLAAVSPTTAAFFRAAYALPFLTAIWLLQRGEKHRTFSARRLAFLSGILLGLDLVFWHRAIELIGAGLATVLGNTQVIFVALLAWWLHGDRPSRASLVAVPVVFSGVTLISGVGSSGAYGTDPARGVVFGIFTGMTYALFLTMFRSAGRGVGSPAGPLLDATLGAAAGTWAASLVEGHIDFTVTWPAHGWLLALALGSQVVGWLLIGAALPRLPAVETSILLVLQPVLTVIWGRLLFAERLAALQGIGIALVVGGVAWVSRRGASAVKIRGGGAAPPHPEGVQSPTPRES